MILKNVTKKALAMSVEMIVVLVVMVTALALSIAFGQQVKDQYTAYKTVKEVKEWQESIDKFKAICGYFPGAGRPGQTCILNA